eukprot:sb/3464267/
MSFKGEIAQRAARVLGNVIREPISKKDHQLLQPYLKAGRPVKPQEVNWHVPTQKMTDLTREMRNIGLANDGYMNFTDVVEGIRRARGLNLWSDGLRTHNLKLMKKHYAQRKIELTVRNIFLTSIFSSAVLIYRTPTVEVLDSLNEVYCGGVGLQYAHIPCQERQDFLTELMENPPKISDDQASRVHKTLVRSENLDRYLASKFSNLKQYSGEGAEGTLAFCQLLFEMCPANEYTKIIFQKLSPSYISCYTSLRVQVSDVVIAIAHRGRISLLTELLELSYERLLRKYSGLNEFHPSEKSIGDVLSHLWQSVDLAQPDGGSVHVSLLPNPSHLEVASSVALGKVRAKMNNAGTSPHYGDSSTAPLALLIHGDAAFIGQGISYENAQMSKLPGYSTGGSIHLITNNLIGFTSDMGNQGSSFGAGDLGKMYDVPVITVNGLDITSINKAVTMAMRYRARFGEDVIVDLQCYRLHGHNQHDEPR